MLSLTDWVKGIVLGGKKDEPVEFRDGKVLCRFTSISLLRTEQGALKVSYRFNEKEVAHHLAEMPKFSNGETLTLHGVEGTFKIDIMGN